ncbi:MAG TPA: ATP-binding protein [Planctomycetes bacterium]|nr:ATP-binding protein [Planctomycetota bacterium]
MRRAEDGAHLRLEFVAAHAVGRLARAELREFGSQQGMTDRALETLEFVAGELIDNAIDHGGGEGAREVSDAQEGVHVDTHLHVAPDRWVLTVADSEGELDPELKSRVGEGESSALDPLGERGRGLFLLMKMVDDMDVCTREGGRGVMFRVERAHGTQG